MAELHPELSGHFGREDHSLWIVAIDVENRRLDHFRHIRRIRGASRETRAGRKADLVVDDEVDRPAGAVAAQSGEAEAFRHNALASKGRITVQKERHHVGPAHFVARVRLHHILLRAALAEHHRIHSLKVTRVGREAQVHLVAIEIAIG